MEKKLRMPKKNSLPRCSSEFGVSRCEVVVVSEFGVSRCEVVVVSRGLGFIVFSLLLNFSCVSLQRLNFTFACSTQAGFLSGWSFKRPFLAFFWKQSLLTSSLSIALAGQSISDIIKFIKGTWIFYLLFIFP